MLLFYQILLGLLASLAVAVLAYLAGLLTTSGAVASILIGTVIIATGPWYSIFLLGAFFVSSGIIHLLKKSLGKTVQDSIAEKGARRDALQVLANSLPALISLAAYVLSGEMLFLIGYAGALSGTTSDTWASEIGILSQRQPRLLTTLRPVTTGESGGISLLGTCASLAGSLFSSLLFYIFYSIDNGFQLAPVYFLLIPIIAGILDSLMDSLLGATVQVGYQCIVCGKLTEKRVHHEQSTQHIKGVSFINNDTVNFLSGLFAVGASLLLAMLYSH